MVSAAIPKIYGGNLSAGRTQRRIAGTDAGSRLLLRSMSQLRYGVHQGSNAFYRDAHLVVFKQREI